MGGAGNFARRRGILAGNFGPSPRDGRVTVSLYLVPFGVAEGIGAYVLSGTDEVILLRFCDVVPYHRAEPVCKELGNYRMTFRGTGLKLYRRNCF